VHHQDAGDLSNERPARSELGRIAGARLTAAQVWAGALADVGARVRRPPAVRDP